MHFLISKIKAKKPLNRLDDEFVSDYLDLFLRRNLKLKNKLDENSLKKRDEEKIVKGVRNELNKIYGQFWLGDTIAFDSHKSTKERENNYKSIYEKIRQ